MQFFVHWSEIQQSAIRASYFRQARVTTGLQHEFQITEHKHIRPVGTLC